ncbi:ATP-dependent DNA ligase [Herbiconiux sp. CPCC 203407]|uniref:ATP-dependent DNA ligase n=1 Tax=Herbiconiux oxytropis TaxID=2970915 RepID=A0AA41XHW5_9MICO|nr:ATP-dependent DNA ligase [Herbiconiux oxytropis]MCS5723033.1 ATP-dependent DNA ligase [Herbiconiux oxytropis]MCS5726898.1 ATP-dependent DNA ligase [Herbiconiux oxytropis]
MGFLYYGNDSYAIEVDDRPLAHLKIALLSLLRAGKSIAFSFERAPDLGSGRETLWICPSTDIRFRFNGSRPPRINELWVRSIIATAETPTGLRLVDEADIPVADLATR